MSEKEIINESSEQEGVVSLQEVAELENPIRRIIEKLRTRIERGEYGLLIGDDASGRLPTRILGDFMKRIFELKKLREPKVIFIPGKQMGDLGINRLLGVFGKRSHMARELNNYFSRLGVLNGDRILIITDTVTSGHSLETLTKLLKELGYQYDIASIGVSKDNEKRIASVLGKDRVISGEYQRQKDINSSNYNTPRIYRESSISGVQKDWGAYKSKPYKQSLSTDNQAEVQKKINKAREEGRIITDRLIQWFGTLDKK